MKRRESLWFGAGCVLASVLSLNYDAAHYVPTAFAFGLLWFCCGIVLMQFHILRRQEQAFGRKESEYWDEWLKKFAEMARERTEAEYEKLKWEEERNVLDEEKEAWKIEQARWEARREIAIREQAQRLFDRETARLGADQIERDMGSNEEMEN